MYRNSIETVMQRFSATIPSEDRQERTPAQEQDENASQQDFLLLLTALVQLASFILLAGWLRRYPIHSVEVKISRTLQKVRSPLLRFIASALSDMNSHPTLNVATALLALFFWKRRLRTEALTMAGATAMTNVFRILLQRLINRPRPSPPLIQVMQKPHGKSFPSGHVLASVTFWGWFLEFRPLLLNGDHRGRRITATIPALLMTLIGPSRVYLGDHWATDVIGSYLLGSSWLALSLRLYRRLKKRSS